MVVNVRDVKVVDVDHGAPIYLDAQALSRPTNFAPFYSVTYSENMNEYNIYVYAMCTTNVNTVHTGPFI